MSEKVSVDVIRRVFVDSEGVYLEIRPHPDFPDSSLELHVDGQKNVEWFGTANIMMSPELARELGRQLIASADHMKPAGSKQ